MTAGRAVRPRLPLGLAALALGLACAGAHASPVRVLPPSAAPQSWPEPLPLAPAPLVRAFLEVCVAHVDALERVYAGRFDEGETREIPGGHARTDEAVLAVETGAGPMPLELAVSLSRAEGEETWRIHDRFCRSPGLAAPAAEVIAALRASVFLPGYRTFLDEEAGFRYAGWGWRGAADDFLLFVGESLSDPTFRFLIARWNSPRR
ncbi:MAG: hypothetical protein AAF968_20770 [Pseudomonadota bacterium]